jgi:flagellar basal body rod protein FlgB
MIKGLFGSSSITSALRVGLEDAMAAHRAIAARVAGAATSSSRVSFEDTLKAKQAKASQEANLQRDMTALADTEIRYEAEAKLLQGAYAGLRAALRERG